MSYAIIGSGAIGSALASQFARQSLDVLVANSRGPESLAELVGKLGKNIKPVTMREALAADIVILAVPYDAVPEAVRAAPNWNDRIVVDATNAINFPAFTPRDLGGRPSTEIISEAIPGARAVKAFNTLPAAVLASDPRQSGGNRVLFLSGNDGKASTDVAALAAKLGFAPIILGDLASGRLAQFGGPLMVHNLTKHA